MIRAALVLLLLSFAGCATVVIPPVHPLRPSPVFDDDDYWFGHSCNAAVAEWLEELGCEVPVVALSANYEVRESARSFAPASPAKPP